MPTPVRWNGDAVVNRLSRSLSKALNEINSRIQTRAKQELRPGHGKRKGNLRRSIRRVRARRKGLRIVGRVGRVGKQGGYHASFVHGGVPAKVRISRRGKAYYHKGQEAIPYLEIGFDHVKPQAGQIIAKHVGS
jgi:hypothetical protein